MIVYMIKRILMILAAILCVTLLLFLLLYSLPDSRIRSVSAYGGGDALDSVFSFFNAGNSFFAKYFRYCYNVLFHLNFGYSPSSGSRISHELARFLRTTLMILICGFAAAMAVGVTAGALTAVRKNSAGDRVTRIILLVLSSVPSYTIALIIAILLVLKIKALPMNIDSRTPKAYIMPTLTIAVGGSSSIARMTRASLLEVLDKPFIVALRAKGVSNLSIVFRHALKNALIPIASTLRGFIAALLCGTFIVEHFFNVQGIGLYMLRSVSGRDHLEILGCTIVMTVVIAALSIGVDALYAFLNPQVRLHVLNVSK